jgi:hypothetical protein
MLTLAWGVGAFGAPYPWAYTPLVIAATILGVTGIWRGRRRLPVGVLLCLGALAGIVVLQLVPLPRGLLNALSPQARTILERQVLTFELESGTHPLSIDPVRTKLGLSFLAGFGIFLVGTACILTRATARQLAGWLAILGTAVALVGIVQNATFDGRIYGFWEPYERGWSFGPFVNRNHFAGWMLMALPLVCGYALALASSGMPDRSGRWHVSSWIVTPAFNRFLLAIFAIAVMSLSVVMSFSRSGLASLAVALVVFGLVVLFSRQPGGGLRLGIAALGVTLLMAVFWVGVDRIAARFGEMDPTSIHERPAIWADTIRIARDFWLTGTGLNTYGVSTLFYQTAVPGRHLREAHSDYLQLAAEGGLLLIIPIVVTILAFAREVRRRVREDSGSIRWIRTGAITSLIAISVQSAVEFSLQMPGNAALFAFVAGLAIHDGRRV